MTSTAYAKPLGIPLSILGLASYSGYLGLSQLSGNQSRVILGWASIMASACAGSGTLCGRLFLLRSAGNVHTPSLISERRMPATSERRWPVNTSTLTQAPAGPPERILKTKVLLTVMDGRDTFRAPEL